jgi:hypothetical protein
VTVRKSLIVLSVFLTLALTSPARAQDWSWVMSIPYAMSGEQIYKIRVLEIDGEPQKELLRYAVDAGERTITVQMMLDVEWEPDLSVSAPEPPIKQITLRIETGKTYLLAARVDIDAPVEAQLDQSYWQPFVYRVD